MTLRTEGIVRARRAGNQAGSQSTRSGQFTIPAAIYRKMPADAMFRPEWHEDGILYRFVGIGTDVTVPDDNSLPDWAKS